MTVTAAILCGGRGTRLRPVVGDLPKCLAPVAGRPFLAYVLDHLVSQGIEKVVLCAGVGWERLRDYVRYEAEVRLAGMCCFSIETEPLGTGGALRNALPLLDSDPVLVLNGDTYCKFDLKFLLNKYEWADCAALTYCRKEWESTGIHLLSKSFLEQSGEYAGYSLDDYSLEKNLEWLLNSGDCHLLVDKGAAFLDIGTPEGYAAAEVFLRSQGAIR